MILFDIFIAFLKIGFLGFGGGYAMMTMMLDEAMKLGLTIHQFADLNALDVLVPGPIAVNAATYVGYITGSFPGAIIATVAVCIPSFIFISIFHYFSKAIKTNKKIQYFMESIKPSAVGLIASTAFILAIGVLFNVESVQELFQVGFVSASLFACVVFVVCAIAHIKYQVNPILLTILSGVIGYFVYYL